MRAELDARDLAILGDSLSVRVSAEYLFGGPVTGSGELVVRRRPHYPWNPPLPGIMRSLKSRIMPYYQPAEEVWRGQFVLDAEGMTTLRVATDAGTSGTAFYEYMIEALVTDSSRREERSSAKLRLGLREFDAWLSAERWVVAPGDDAKVHIQLRDANGNPVASTVSLKITRLGDAEEIQIRTAELEISAEGRSEYEFELPETGHYAVRIHAVDGRGNEIKAECFLWCADPDEEQLVHAAGGLTLIAERDAVFENDIARVLLVSEFPGASIYLARAHAGAVESEVIQLTGSSRILEIPVTALHRPSFEIRASTANDFRLHYARLEIQAPPWEQALDITLEFDQENYGPGDEATLNLSILDSQGNPAQSPVTIAVIDGAVLEVVPRAELDPIARFFAFAPLRVPPPMVSAELQGGYLFADGELKDDLRRSEIMEESGRIDGDMVAGRSRGLKSSMAQLPAAASPQEAPTVELRTDFRTTAIWRTSVFPDRDGHAQIQVPLPQSLTEWNALAVALDSDTRAGVAETTAMTRKDLMIRLNHPRVFREHDRMLLSATVHNETDEDLVCTVNLLADPLVVEGGERDVIVRAGDQRRVEWWANVPEGSAALRFERDGETGRLSVWPERCRIRASVRSKVDGDAFERYVDLIPHGSPLSITALTELRGSGSLDLSLPGERVPEAERATLILAPSVLSSCIDALPYLAQYPYGCTEQTLSRFVPAVALRHITSVLGTTSQRIDPELDDKIRVGLARIAEFQRPDGGWGWWKQAESDPYMTAHVLIALARAAQSGIDVDRDMLTRGRDAMRNMLPRLETRADDMAYALFALSDVDLHLNRSVRQDDTMARYAASLFRERDSLRDYARALLASYLQASGSEADALLVIQFLPNTVQRDEDYGTVHWGRKSGYYWRGDGAVEATAFALQALMAVDPQSELIPAAARWLVQNRRGHRWDSTRSSAHAIYALCDFRRGLWGDRKRLHDERLDWRCRSRHAEGRWLQSIRRRRSIRTRSGSVRRRRDAG